MRIIANDRETPGCCGVRQIRDFSNAPGRYDDGDIGAEGKTEEEVCKNFFNSLMQHCDYGYVYQIWFVKCKRWDGEYDEEYQREPLRKLIAAMPGVVDLGEHRNPNTGNMIQGYQWRTA